MRHAQHVHGMYIGSAYVPLVIRQTTVPRDDDGYAKADEKSERDARGVRRRLVSVVLGGLHQIGHAHVHEPHDPCERDQRPVRGVHGPAGLDQDWLPARGDPDAGRDGGRPDRVRGDGERAVGERVRDARQHVEVNHVLLGDR